MNNGFTNIREWCFKCDTCGEEVPSGIISISNHYAKCQGKQVVDNVNKIYNMPLSTEDKMCLLRKQFGYED